MREFKECESSRVREFKECESSRVRECKSLRVREGEIILCKTNVQYCSTQIQNENIFKQKNL